MVWIVPELAIEADVITNPRIAEPIMSFVPTSQLPVLGIQGHPKSNALSSCFVRCRERDHRVRRQTLRERGSDQRSSRSRGGHDIPERDIRLRHYAEPANLIDLLLG